MTNPFRFIISVESFPVRSSRLSSLTPSIYLHQGFPSLLLPSTSPLPSYLSACATLNINKNHNFSLCFFLEQIMPNMKIVCSN